MKQDARKDVLLMQLWAEPKLLPGEVAAQLTELHHTFQALRPGSTRSLNF